MNAQRRQVLRVLGTGALVSAVAAPDGEAQVTPGEDLMQEHGVLERLLLIYAEVARAIEAGEPVDLAATASAARIMRRFIEDYHERNEERFVASCLDSIIADGYPLNRLEVLVVDGMSTDNTREIVASYSERYPFIVMLDNPLSHQGLFKVLL